MRFEGRDGEVVAANVDDRLVVLTVSAGEHDGFIEAHLDENHATALALALQAAVAEIQARAVGR